MNSIRTNKHGSTTDYDYYPDLCPVCHRSAQIILISTEGHIFPQNADENDTKLQLLFQCPRQACATYFIVEYERDFNPSSARLFFAAKRFYPKMYKEAPVADGVLAISPSFVKILQQATVAESEGLDQISGIGYRKALEFLIKDYCIYKNPNEATAIRSSLLGNCINDFVSDANVKDCATRAAWLGNDEAHYERVWTSHDVDDLKLLIQLTQNWIANELLTTKYRTELTKRKAKGAS